MIKVIAENKKKSFYRRNKSQIVPYLLLAIPIIWWCVFFLYAFIRSVYFSFTDLRFSTELISKFNFDNYVRLFQDETFYKALSNTFIWTVVMTISNNLMGLIMAYLVFKLSKGNKVFLALLFWPTLVSAVAGAQIIKMLFNPSDSGLINNLIIKMGGEPLGWYNDPKLALFSLMVVPFLLGFSTQMMLFYVALLGVPKAYVEAARLETSSSTRILWHVYIPLIKNAISLNLVLSIIGNIKVLGPMQLVSDSGQGGPLNSTMSIMLMLYNKGITGYEMGYACSIGIVALIIILALSLIQQKLTGKGDDYE